MCVTMLYMTNMCGLVLRLRASRAATVAGELSYHEASGSCQQLVHDPERCLAVIKCTIEGSISPAYLRVAARLPGVADTSLMHPRRSVMRRYTSAPTAPRLAVAATLACVHNAQTTECWPDCDVLKSAAPLERTRTLADRAISQTPDVVSSDVSSSSYVTSTSGADTLHQTVHLCRRCGPA